MIPSTVSYKPQYYGADQPQPLRFKHPKHSFGIENGRRNESIHIPHIMSSLALPGFMTQALPAHRTPFDNYAGLDRLGGLRGRCWESSVNGRPLLAQHGIGKDDEKRRNPLQNSNM